MKQVTKYRNKNVLVLGLAKSGFSASNLLHELGANVVVNDKTDLSDSELAKELESKGIKVVSGHHPLELLEGIDLIVKNPGIPYSNPLLNAALKKNIEIITEVELAYFISEGKIIGITGSNGKTTTTTLIFKMLEAANKLPLIAGNIGEVACEVAKGATPENILVTELSSFQLMGTNEFRPSISVFLNLIDAHLDYHGTREEYGDAKSKIFENQTVDDFLIYNLDDEEVVSRVTEANATLVPFSINKELDNGVYVKNDAIYFGKDEVIAINDIVLPGLHNIQNICAAIAVVKLIGVDNQAISNVLTTFAGVKHRTQYVRTLNTRKFYNDSKATNIFATQTALLAFENPVVLIAGGLDRGNGFDDLIPYFKNVHTIVVYGETADKLMDAARNAGIEKIMKVDNLVEAVDSAYSSSNEGDVVLLSPACASWDQFKTFEERGELFIKEVHRLV